MKRIIILLSAFLMIHSCIPLRIAPTIKDYKVTQGKKFKKTLPKRQMFIFADPKPANQFYKYVNTKFELQDINVFDELDSSHKCNITLIVDDCRKNLVGGHEPMSFSGSVV